MHSRLSALFSNRELAGHGLIANACAPASTSKMCRNKGQILGLSVEKSEASALRYVW